MEWNDLKQSKTKTFGSAYAILKGMFKLVVLYYFELAQKMSITMNQFVLPFFEGLHTDFIDL